MSPRDIRAELSSARVEAPPELRARVRLIAAQAPPPRRLTRRRLTLVLVPVAAAAVVAAAVVLSTRSGPQVRHGEALSTGAIAPKAAAVAPSPTRAQHYEATLRLQVRAIAAAVSSAQRIATSLGGYPVSVHVATGPKAGTADVVLRVPRAHVQSAVAQLSRLGTVVGERLDIQDLQAGLNASDRTIARLQKQLAALRAQPQTDAVKRQIAVLTQRVVTLQREHASTLRRAHFATVRLSLATVAAKHHRHLNVWPWLGGAAAMLVLVLAWRAVRRLRENALLSRP